MCIHALDYVLNLCKMEFNQKIRFWASDFLYFTVICKYQNSPILISCDVCYSSTPPLKNPMLTHYPLLRWESRELQLYRLSALVKQPKHPRAQRTKSRDPKAAKDEVLELPMAEINLGKDHCKNCH